MLAIKVSNLVKVFKIKRNKKIVALRGITFSLPKGHILGYLGPNGAGKTTTIRILTGFLEPDDGYAELLGYDISREFERVKHLINIMSTERTYLIENMTIERNLRLFGRLYGFRGLELKRRIRELLEFFDLKEHKDKRIYELSRGLRVRSSLCRALINYPEVLFLDEPTSGIDVICAEQIRSYIRKISREGTTIFLATHNMYEAQRLSDYLAFLDRGRIIAYGRTEEILEKFSPLEKVVRIKCDKPRELAKHLLSEGYEVEEKGGEVRVRLRRGQELNPLLVEIASTARIDFISVVEPSLEEVFKHLYGRGGGHEGEELGR
ncbi:MAG: ABC transporter ATP-binding protein [Thermoprotei archaeon]|nr:MAG: ABC transporter ATP-binding protein [Thermoprotei archaeon]